MLSYAFDTEKSLNSILFIANKIAKDGIADKYATLKILYFAEKSHLATYGRLITDDRFAALKYGPVPSNSCDILNSADHSHYFTILNNKKFIPLKQADEDYLSATDIECITQSINENSSLDFDDLMVKSHDEAYHEAFDNGLQYMDIQKIAQSHGADNGILGYIKEHYEMANLMKHIY